MSHRTSRRLERLERRQRNDQRALVPGYCFAVACLLATRAEKRADAAHHELSYCRARLRALEDTAEALAVVAVTHTHEETPA